MRIATMEDNRIHNARITARYWSDGIAKFSPADQQFYRHPLAMVIAALDGEDDPKGLGIDDADVEAKKLRQTFDPYTYVLSPEGLCQCTGFTVVDAADCVWQVAEHGLFKIGSATLYAWEVPQFPVRVLLFPDA